ncbi:hypothetical protein evm_006985 [Chilo suppressalis]|nr:hypothetical protein evm_006985 [Chilo suppressalis]
MNDWTYVTTSIELSVGGAVARLVGSRRALGHVDAALDSLHHIPRADLAPPVPDDIEEWCASMGSAWSAGSELIAAAALCAPHCAHRLATLLMGELVEALMTVWLDDLSASLRSQLFVVFERMSEGGDVMPGNAAPEPDLEKTCAAIMDNMPTVMYIFGEEKLKDAVHLSVHSLSHESLNKDLGFRLLDVFAVHFKRAAAIRNPSFDAN